MVLRKFPDHGHHNDKHNKINGSRDEFRIYLNRSFAPNNFSALVEFLQKNGYYPLQML